jgi:hypothetical protein
MAMYSFVPAFREATFCGVPSCVFGELGCVAGEKKVAEHLSSAEIKNVWSYTSTPTSAWHSTLQIMKLLNLWCSPSSVATTTVNMYVKF